MTNVPFESCWLGRRSEGMSMNPTAFCCVTTRLNPRVHSLDLNALMFLCMAVAVAVYAFSAN